jgi:peptidoglycan lytic transglycosylase G
MWRIGLIILIVLVLLVAVSLVVPAMALHSYGPPAPGLSAVQVLEYSATLLWDDGRLTRPLDPSGPEQAFRVEQGEGIGSISGRLEQAGLIGDAGALRDYLIYTGLDTSVQAGEYKLSPALSIVDVAHKMQDATPTDVTFVVWPGWRMEEVAESLPTSGLDITPYSFVATAMTTHGGFDFLEGKATTEGFLYPDTYVLPRATTVDQLVDTLVRNFSLHLTAALREGFTRQGLSVYQAVTLASIVEREAVKAEEAPMIASVYINRLRSAMKLDADPTVQYALGYNPVQHTWWTNPLGLVDLQVVSPFNTYSNDGLPPAPIANPGPTALQAVANPADSPYYYFNARCDGSGYHVFAQTFEEHLQNLCP